MTRARIAAIAAFVALMLLVPMCTAYLLVRVDATASSGSSAYRVVTGSAKAAWWMDQVSAKIGRIAR